MSDPRIPVTVVTGALGSGKTTLVNHLVRRSGRRLAVIVNEFGDIGIDGDLIESGAEELIELSSGCICCVVRGDLIRTLRGLVKGAPPFDHIVIETTGLANPAPVIQTFYADQQLAGRCRLDGVVTLVDGVMAGKSLDDPDWQTQVALASVLLINKASEAADLAPLESQLRELNPFAELHRIDRGTADPARILETGGFDLERLAAIGAERLAPRHDHGPGGITSVSLTCGSPMDQQALERWLGELLSLKGEDILRTKGLIRVANETRPLAIQAVHMLIEGDFIDIARAKAAPRRESRLVFIGRNLNTRELGEGFLACRAETTG